MHKKTYYKDITSILSRNLIRNSILFLLCAISIEVFAQDSTAIALPDSLKKIIEKTQTSDSTKIVAITLPSLDSNSWDFRIFKRVNYSRSDFKNFLIPKVDATMLPMAILMPLTLFSYGRLENKTYEENTGYLLTASLAVNSALTFATKMIVQRKRVRVFLVTSGVYPKVYKTVDPYSFPSGHTSTAFTIATMFALRYPTYPQVYLPIYLWATTIGYGRMYLGMHFPSDVFVGSLIGAGSSVLIYSLRKEFFKFKNNVLSEDKNDAGSIQAGTLSIFTAGLLSSILFNQFIPVFGNHIILNATPFHNNDLGIGINFNYRK